MKLKITGYCILKSHPENIIYSGTLPVVNYDSAKAKGSFLPDAQLTRPSSEGVKYHLGDEVEVLVLDKNKYNKSICTLSS